MLPNPHDQDDRRARARARRDHPSDSLGQPIGPTPVAPHSASHRRPRSCASSSPTAALTGEMPASAPPAASRSRCSASEERSRSHNDAPATPTARQRRPADQPHHYDRSTHTMSTQKRSPRALSVFPARLRAALDSRHRASMQKAGELKSLVLSLLVAGAVLGLGASSASAAASPPPRSHTRTPHSQRQPRAGSSSTGITWAHSK